MTAGLVAEELAMSPFTVRDHLKRIHANLEARNSAHAVAIAIRRQLI
jgi:DNA-binding CsgD family transcriptional regulator